MKKIGLYLAGGGARGAYQAGALKAIQQILDTDVLPFCMLSGVSVGSINAAMLAQHADDFSAGVQQLVALWSNVHCNDVFNASNSALIKSVLRNASHVFTKHRHSGYLLDTTPLANFIGAHLDFEKINQHIANHTLETLEVLSSCYSTRRTISFYQHTFPTFEDWFYPRHISQRAALDKAHILSSSALPLFFPAVQIDGIHYGDGSMGLISPLRGALRFGMEKVLVLGSNRLPIPKQNSLDEPDCIDFAQVLGNMFSGVFMDNLDRDIEMVNRMNEIARLLSMWKKRYSSWRPVETLYLRPTMDISLLAQTQFSSMPVLLRFLLNGMGARRHSGDLLSFLLFEASFTTQLITAGYNDTIANEAAIRAFFN